MGDLRFGAIDDYFMSTRLTGGLGTEYVPHLIFVNAIYGYLLLPLYHIFPSVGWYYLGEMFSVFISFGAICYVLLRWCENNWGVLLSVLFVSLFASDFYLVLQFTQCASILGASGMLLFVYGIRKFALNGIGTVEKKTYVENWTVTMVALFLLLWSSVMRWHAFLMGAPFFFLGLLFAYKECWRVKWRCLALLLVVVCGAFAAHRFDEQIYQRDEYSAFMKFQPFRTTFGDDRNYDINAAMEDMEESGLSGKDLQILSEWIFYDTEAFSVDSLRPYKDIISAYRDEISIGKYPRIILSALKMSMEKTVFWAWFFFGVLIFLSNRKYTVYLWCSFGLIVALMWYLLGLGRLVYRVESGFWLYASVMAVPLFGRFKLEISKKILWSVLGAICVVNLFGYAIYGKYVRDPTTGNIRTIAVKDSTDYGRVFEYINSESDKMFLLSMDAFMRFSHHKNPPYMSEPVGSYRRTVSLGYWTPFLPEVTQALADYGVTNPMKDVVHDNVIVVNEGRLCDFLQRHYYDSVLVDTLKVIGKMTFYKYRLMNSSLDSVASD